jgi:exopolysaccharide biosynthesis protein
VISGIAFEGIAFDSRNYQLVVADQAEGPGSVYADAAAAAHARGGVAAINAGFFTPEGEPLGLVMASGKISGSWNSASSLGTGVWHSGASGTSRISRRENLGRTAATGMRELIQAGPLLVENGRTVTGLESAKSSARSVVCWDGGTRWWIGCSAPCTLAALGQALADGQPAGWPVRHALNLDGGRSSDLWISGSISGGPVVRRPPWNRPVRNFLVLVAK